LITGKMPALGFPRLRREASAERRAAKRQLHFPGLALPSAGKNSA